MVHTNRTRHEKCSARVNRRRAKNGAPRAGAPPKVGAASENERRSSYSERRAR